MNGDKMTGPPLVTAAEWFAGGERIGYDPASARVLTAGEQSRMYSRGYHPSPAQLAEFRSAVTRRDGAAFLHRAAGFTAEHRRQPVTPPQDL